MISYSNLLSDKKFIGIVNCKISNCEILNFNVRHTLITNSPRISVGKISVFSDNR